MIKECEQLYKDIAVAGREFAERVTAGGEDDCGSKPASDEDEDENEMESPAAFVLAKLSYSSHAHSQLLRTRQTKLTDSDECVALRDDQLLQQQAPRSCAPPPRPRRVSSHWWNLDTELRVSSFLWKHTLSLSLSLEYLEVSLSLSLSFVARSRSRVVREKNLRGGAATRTV